MEETQLTSQRSTQDAASTNQANNFQGIMPPLDVPRSAGRDEARVVQELFSILHKLTAEKPRQSWFKRLPAHPLTLLVLGSILSFGVGSWLTYFYTTKAQEVAARRSFSDELNKLRIQKVGEVWERLDQDEVTIERLVNELTDNDADHTTQKGVLEQLRKMIETDKEIIGQHRFWLGKETYDKIQRYLDITIFLLTRRILEPESEVESLVKDRETARSDIESERVKFLTSETVQDARRCYLF